MSSVNIYQFFSLLLYAYGIYWACTKYDRYSKTGKWVLATFGVLIFNMALLQSIFFITGNIKASPESANTVLFILRLSDITQWIPYGLMLIAIFGNRASGEAQQNHSNLHYSILFGFGVGLYVTGRVLIYNGAAKPYFLGVFNLAAWYTWLRAAYWGRLSQSRETVSSPQGMEDLRREAGAGDDQCPYCRKSFATPSGGIVMGDFESMMDRINRKRTFCSTCNKFMCLGCAFAASKKRGLDFNCCPECGAPVPDDYV